MQRHDVEVGRRAPRSRTPPARGGSPPRPAGTRARRRRARRATSLRTRRRHVAARAAGSSARRPRRRCSIVTSKRRPSARSDGHRRGTPRSARRRASPTSPPASGPGARALQPTQQRERHVALRGAARGTRRAAPRPRPSAPGSDSSRRVSTPSVTKHDARRVPTPRPRSARDSRPLADRLAQLLRHAPRRQARRQPPRLEHEDLPLRRRRRAARAARASSCPRPAALPAPRSAFVAATRRCREAADRSAAARAPCARRATPKLTSASNAPLRSAADAASSPPSVPPAFFRRFAAALVVVPLRMLHRHGHFSLAHFRSVSASPLQAPRVAALQAHRARPLMRRRHRRAALRARRPHPPPSPAPPSTPILFGLGARRLPERQHLLVATAVAIDGHALAPERVRLPVGAPRPPPPSPTRGKLIVFETALCTWRLKRRLHPQVPLGRHVVRGREQPLRLGRHVVHAAHRAALGDALHERRPSTSRPRAPRATNSGCTSTSRSPSSTWRTNETA